MSTSRRVRRWPCAHCGFHLVGQVLFHVHNHLLLLGHHVAVQISLLAALVVGVAGGDAVSGCPFVEFCPAVRIVDVALLGIYLVEFHQSFVIDRPCPEAAGANLAHVGRHRGVAVFLHK